MTHLKTHLDPFSISTPVPLYQEYLLKSMKADIQRVHQTGLSDLVASQQWLPGLECPAQPGLARSARLSLSPTPAVLKDRGAYSLWQELSVVKEQGLLGLLTAKEVRRQEVGMKQWFSTFFVTGP